MEGKNARTLPSNSAKTGAWFHRWWRRYLEAGPEGLYDLPRVSHDIARHISPELERAILTVRRRLQAHASPAPRCNLAGAPVTPAEFKALGTRPPPSERTTISAPAHGESQPGARGDGSLVKSHGGT